MSIALHKSGSMQGSGFVHEFMGVFSGERGRTEAEDDEESDSGSSSLGKDSDEECEASEVESSLKGPLDTMDSLEEVFPSKKGISMFYSGKSKSFTSLPDAYSVSSVKDLSKPEDPYSRKRKILIARANVFENNQNYFTKYNGSDISKRKANFIASAVDAASSFSCHRNNFDFEGFSSVSSSPSSNLPPLHPQPHGKRSTCNKPPPPERGSPCRSLSLSDAQFAAATCTN